MGFVLAMLVLFGLAAGAQADVYWTNQQTGSIGRANQDGTGSNPSLITGASAPGGVAIEGGSVYWANGGTNSIGRANLDGTGVTQSFITGASSPVGIAVDGNYVYWANQGSNSIGRAHLDGSGAIQNFITGTSNSYAVAVDSQHIYWTNANTGSIGRADLDGTNPVQNFITGANNPLGVAVDGQHVYWSNFNTGYIGRANLDATNPNQQYVNTQGAPFGMAVDGQHIYWADSQDSRIGRATLDAATVTPAFIAGVSSPVGVATQAGLAGPPSALISSPADGSSYPQGTVVSATYSCSPGANGGALAAGSGGCSGPVPDGQPIDTSSVGAHAFAVTAADTDGQTAAATADYVVTGAPARAAPPSVSIASPGNGATYGKGAVVTASYSCQPGLGGGILRGGASGCSGSVPAGQPIDTSSLGAHAFTVTAADTDGQSATATTHYTVTGALPPRNLTPPSIVPDVRCPVVGRCRQIAHTYDCDPGTWEGRDPAIPYQFAWWRLTPDKRYLGGVRADKVATGQTYSPHASLIGLATQSFVFECLVTASNAAGSTSAKSPAKTLSPGPRLRLENAPYGNFRIRGIDVFQVVQPNSGATQFNVKPAGAFPNYPGGGTPTNWRFGLPGYLGGVGLIGNPQRVPYAGVLLDPDKPTAAIVYVDIQDQPPPPRSKTLDVTLEMKRTDGALVYTRTVTIPTPPVSRTGWVTAAERANPAYGVRFNIPSPSAVKPDVRFDLHATVHFTPGFGVIQNECDDRDCSADDQFTLSNVDAVPAEGPGSYGDLLIAPLALVRGAQPLPSPSAVLGRARQIFPNALGMSPGPYLGVPLDITQATNWTATPDPNPKDPGGFICNGVPYAAPNTLDNVTRSCRWAAVSAIVDDWSTRNPPRVIEGNTVRRMYDVVLGIQDYSVPQGSGSTREPGWTSGNIGDVTPTTSEMYPGGPAPRSIVNANVRPITAAAHEFGHMLSAPHAGSGTNSCTGNGEAWPPDNAGRLQGTKLDADPSRPAVAPQVDGQGATALYDLMSYCADLSDTATYDGDQWISPFNWDRFSRRFIELGQRVPRGEVLTARAAADAAGTRRPDLVYAIGTVTPSGARIARLVPQNETQAAPPTASASPLRLRAYASNGSLIAETGASVEFETLEHQRLPGGVSGAGTFTAAVPVGAATVELVRDGVVLDRLSRPLRTPVVRLLTPRAGAHARAGRALVVRWSASEPGGGRSQPEASVDYSADNGQTWRTVFLGHNTGRAVVPGSYLQASRRARIRVGVNDGFNETRVVSKPFRADGAPPIANIRMPARREQLQAGTPIELLGDAYDDTGARLPGRSLTWYAGRQRIGTGELLTARLPPGRYTLRLLARDASGRTGLARLAARVSPVRLQLLNLSFAQKVRRGTRKLAVQVRASARATLRAAGKRYRVDTRLRTIIVTLPRKPTIGVLRLPIKLVPDGSATGKVRGWIAIARG